MEFKDHFYFGIIHKTIGLHGLVSVKVDVDDISRYRKLEHIFVEENKQLIPYFLQSIIVKNNDYIQFQIEGVDTITKAERLITKNVFLPTTLLPKLKGNKFYYHEIIGFEVIDQTHGNIGIVEKVLDFSYQDVLQIKQNYIEILVPVLDHIIKNVDREKKEIHIETPDGLIELYTQPQNNNNDEEE